MVFTPHQPLKLESVGLGTATPRAVPLDGLVALLSTFVNGELLGRVALAVPLVAAGWGARRLAGATRPDVQLLVGGFAVWNPFVVERLALGQWALLWAYGAMPWLVRTANAIRREGITLQRALSLVAALGASAITPTGAVLALLVSVVVAFSGNQRRSFTGVATAGVMAQIPWLLPSLFASAAPTSDPAGVAAFAARGENGGGPLVSLLGLGGIWDRDVMPGSRSGPLGWLTALFVVVVLVAGWSALRARLGATLHSRLVVLAGGGFVLAIAGAVPGLDAMLRWSIDVLPGAGLLRDGQKWLMPFVLLAVLSAACAVERVAVVGWRATVATAAAVLPVLLLPDALALLKGPLTPVRYPSDFAAVAEHVTGPGAALALPFASYHSYPWAPGHTVIDPMPRWLRTRTIVDDRLVVSGRTLSGEDETARRVAELINTSGARPAEFADGLRQLGIRWVVVQTGASGPTPPDLSGLHEVEVGSGAAVRLYETTGELGMVPGTSNLRRIAVIALDVTLLALVAVAWLAIAARAAHRLLQLG
jgi:hypothetical protein